MLELSKLDSESPSCELPAPRISVRPRSLQRISSRESYEQIYSRIRVPSQRAAMAEMAAAAERIEQQMAKAGRSPAWAATPGGSRASLAPLELDSSQLDAVLQPPASPAIASTASSSGQPPDEMMRAADVPPPSCGFTWSNFFGGEGQPPPPSSLSRPLQSVQPAAPPAAPPPSPPMQPASAPSADEAAASSRNCPAHLVPTAFQWCGAANKLYLCGTFNGWGERIVMHRRANRDDWWVVLNLPPGEYAYKFVVHDTSGNISWKHAEGQPTLVDVHGHSNNWLAVVDQSVYERGEEDGGEAEPFSLCVMGTGGSASLDDLDAEEGYSQATTAEYLELLFAQEPPAAPAYLLAAPIGVPEAPELPPARAHKTRQPDPPVRGGQGFFGAFFAKQPPAPPSPPPPPPPPQPPPPPMPVHATLLHASTIAPPPPPFDERQLRPPFSFTTDINSLGPIFGGRTDPISGGRTDDLVSASPTMINAAQPTLLMNVLDDVYELHDAAPSKWRNGGMGIMGAVDDHGFFGGMMVDSTPTTTSALPSPIRNAEGHAVDFRLAAPLKEVKCPPRTHPVGARPAYTPWVPAPHTPLPEAA